MKKSFFCAVITLTMSLLISCSSFTIDKGHGFTQVKIIDNLEVYKYLGDFRNTCDCILAKDDKTTMLLCLSRFDFLKNYTPIRKRVFIKYLQEKLYPIKYHIDEFDNRIAFAEVIEKPINKISKDYLIDHFTELAKFTTKYDAILEEVVKTILEYEHEFEEDE